MTASHIHKTADVYKGDALAAQLVRTPLGVEFRYRESYLESGGPAVASTLPIDPQPRLTPAGAVPPYFAGLLPEGRRLSALRRSVKTSADDELSLLIAVGADTIGDVRVIPTDDVLPPDRGTITLEAPPETVRFEDLLELANLDGKPPTLAGMQDKASASMITLPVSRQHERYILKLDPPEYPHLVENESHFLEWSRAAKITTAASRIVRDLDGVPGLLVMRFDRVLRNGRVTPLAVEDAAQALDVWPADKYNVTFEQAAHSLLRLCNAPMVAARAILQQLTFAWLTGNGDLHAKNLSVLTAADGDTRLAPAYDLPSTLFYGDTTLALTVGGRDTLTARRIRELGSDLGLLRPAVDRVIDSILARTESLIDSLTALPFDERRRSKAVRLLSARRRDLESG